MDRTTFKVNKEQKLQNEPHTHTADAPNFLGGTSPIVPNLRFWSSSFLVTHNSSCNLSHQSNANKARHFNEWRETYCKWNLISPAYMGVGGAVGGGLR